MRKIITRVLAVSLLILTYVAYAAILRAQDHELVLPQISGVDRELALALAKVTWNESTSYAEPRDLYLIAQVTHNRGETNVERLRWLRSHSSCVLTDRPLDDYEQRFGNCPWSRGLTWSFEQPEHWPTAIRWRARGWSLILRRASQIVQDWDFPRPCEGRPMTWGSVRLDMRRALERGLVPHRCEDRMGNVGFSFSAGGHERVSTSDPGAGDVGP